MTHPDHRFQHLAGLLALIAGPLAWASLLLGLSAADFNFDLLSDPRATLGLGAGAAPTLRWSFLLSMAGAYLCLIPAALWLESALGATPDMPLRWYTFCGLGYLGLGAMGAAILAAVWPLLIGLHAGASDVQRDTIVIAFQTATGIAEDGLQGMLQNLAGGVWWVGIGSRLWPRRRILGGFTWVLGCCLLINGLGNLLASEALALLGLSATLLLAPIWSIWIGLAILRGRLPVLRAQSP